MNDYVIPLSTAPLRRQLIVSGIFAGAALLITTFFFQYAVTGAPGLQRMMMTILWIGMPTVWIVGALAMRINYLKTSYILTKGALVIRKAGWFGSGTESLYSYDTILSVNSNSRRYGAYGSLELKLEQDMTVVLSGIVSPDEQARELKRRVVAARAR